MRVETAIEGEMIVETDLDLEMIVETDLDQVIHHRRLLHHQVQFLRTSMIDTGHHQVPMALEGTHLHQIEATHRHHHHQAEGMGQHHQATTEVGIIQLIRVEVMILEIACPHTMILEIVYRLQGEQGMDHHCRRHLVMDIPLATTHGMMPRLGMAIQGIHHPDMVVPMAARLEKHTPETATLRHPHRLAVATVTTAGKVGPMTERAPMIE